ncbi:hypothetical protein QR680_017174 [Steinernema hermaphroditum]|uniref:Lysosome membrane protein 2 n=1 Tax=Steinernema hermaphroditum TaxID=289476 RepID=A0AA39LNI7_9BILA|nr:hypothetical protein QR680_017174 [Steinernema hermaphroditum]
MRKRTAVGCSFLSLGLFGVGVALLVIGLVFAFSVLPKDLDERVKKNYVFGTNADGTLNDFTRRWRWRVDAWGNDATFLELYLYNYSNVQDVLSLGFRPDVVEMGPYTYRQLTTVDLEEMVPENGTQFFSFSKKKTFVFDAQKSCQGCSPDDRFIVPDPVFFGLFDQVGSVEKVTAICRILGTKCLPELKKILSSIPTLLGMAVDTFSRYGPFVDVSVQELIFDGWKDPLYEKVITGALRVFVWAMDGRTNVSSQGIVSEPKFHFKTNTSRFSYVVASGAQDYRRNGQIFHFEGMNVTSGEGTLPDSWWNATSNDCDAESARRLHGTDGDVFHPLLEKSESLSVFVEEVCRPLDLVFQKQTTVSDLDAFRFALSSDVFNYSLPENCGFCAPLDASFYGRPANASCLPSGVLDLSQCTPNNLPVAASNPHFFDAALEVQRLFPRTVRKEKEREVITVDVEPKSGTVLRSNKRLQFNVLFQNFPDIGSYSQMPSGVYPMFWINETYVISDGNLKTLKKDLFRSQKTWKLVCYIVGIGLGSLLIVVSVFSCIVTCFRAAKEKKSVRITPFSGATRVVSSSIEVSDASTLRAREMGKHGLVICSGLNILLFLAGCGLICAGLVVWLSVFPDKFVSEIKKNKVLGLNDDGSFNDYTRSWLDGSGIRQNFYFFNYTNVFGIVDRGAKPDVHEKGPYAYRKVYTYEQRDFLNGTAEFEYNYRTTYFFDPEHSCATCRPGDVFLVPDPVFQIMMNFVTYDNLCNLLKAVVVLNDLHVDVCSLAPLLDQILKNDLPSEILKMMPDLVGLGVDGFTRYGPFVPVTVEDLLYKGYKDPLFDKFLELLAKFINGLQIKIGMSPFIPPTKITLPVITSPPIHLFNNNSLSDTFTVLTGLADFRDIGRIVAFTNNNGTATNGTSLPETWWSPPENLTSCTEDLAKKASDLNGTSGQFFHVQLKKDDSPYVYVDDVCRSMRLVFDSEVTVRDVAGFRYVIDPLTFNYSVPENCGFCTTLTADFYDRSAGSFCLPDGLLHLGGCKPLPLQLPDSLPIHLIKLPIVASNPHFYGAAPEVIGLFPRFEPSKETDMTTLDIEPQTGTLLRANKRLQMNIMFRRFPNISSFSNILSGAYPMFWVNETYTIDDSSWRQLHDDVLGMKQTIKLVCYIVGVGLGALLIVLSLVSCFVSICCRNRRQEQPRQDNKFQEERIPSTPFRSDSGVQLRARPIGARRKD